LNRAGQNWLLTGLIVGPYIFAHDTDLFERLRAIAGEFDILAHVRGWNEMAHLAGPPAEL
jgi:hypothetical protein